MLSKNFLLRPRLVHAALCSTTSSTSTPACTSSSIDTITVVNGLPHITIPLPSRAERCVFALKPISNNVGDFLAMLRAEDRGIDRAVVKNAEGVRIASNTSIQTLFDQQFTLAINDQEYAVAPVALEAPGREELAKLSDVRQLVGQLYEALHVGEFKLSREQELGKQLEALAKELAPLEEQRAELLRHAEDRSAGLTWLGLGLMSLQFGVLARLTWWEYSWDIMEPVTYFVTYGTAIAGYAYFVMTRQEFMYEPAKGRHSLLTFHRKASKHRWDVARYNELKAGVAAVEGDLRTLREPLALHTARPAAKKAAAGLFGIGNLRDIVSKMQ